ncbi:MAG: peroxide stress protein YaaA [Gemmatimonadetes bacterium]|nr:peroxide stress protein YaaA [Gemmatimonadota bacterium]
MLIVLSPAKSLDFESPAKTKKFTEPAFLEESAKLVKAARKLKPRDLSNLMSISDALAELNHARFAAWKTPFTLENAKQALFAFQGDVYQGLNADRFTAADLTFAQKHLRILSGLYGVLRPLDLIQPYRLEMGRKFATKGKEDLYDFWGSRLTEKLNDEFAAERAKKRTLVNLASNEYFKSVRPKELEAEVVTPVFQDWTNGRYRVVSFYAKKARGEMAAYIIRNRVKSPAGLHDFRANGYRYSARESTDAKPVFLRKQKK